MYLRTTERTKADGTKVRYFQLADNVWDSSKQCAVARVVYNFGRADQLDGDKLRRLARSILRAVGDVSAGQETCVEDLKGKLVPIKVREAWPYGGVFALHELWKELEVDKVLSKVLRSEGITQPLALAVFAMVANRALAPCSKLYCFEQWLREDVFLPGAERLQLHHLYRAMDLLEEHKVEVEKSVFFATADLLNADVDIVFYDTTSVHFEIEDQDEDVLEHNDEMYEPMRRRGHSKNGRTDAPQVVVALAVTRDGLPVRSWVFPGQTTDVTTPEQIKKDLAGWRLGRCVFVGDTGMNSAENRRMLALGSGKYILGCKMRGGDEVTTLVLSRPGRYREVADNLRVKEVVVEDSAGTRRYVVCHNPDEQKRQREHRAKVVTQLEHELSTLRPAEDERLSKRACELLASRRYGKYLKQTKEGIALNQAAIKRAGRYDGKWVLTSNDESLSAEDLAMGYKQLLRVEQCFRQLKSGLRVRPVYHWRPWRIQAHVTLSVLALLLERVAETRCRMTWRNVVDELETIKVIEYDHGEVRVRQTTQIRFNTHRLLTCLRLPEPPRVHSVTQVPKDIVDRNDDDES